MEGAVPGNSGHLVLARKAGPRSAEPLDNIAQWCLPLRRQQAGSAESESELNAGAISEKLMITSSKLDKVRRKTKV